MDLRRTSVPLGIGPHEGREAALMAAGRKPLARFFEAWSHAHHFPVAQFAPLVAAGSAVMVERTVEDVDGRSTRLLYYALPGEEWRIEAAYAMDLDLLRRTRPFTEADDIAMGRLLGYSEEEIQAFLTHTAEARRKIAPCGG
jgi:hypothetical protein